MTKEDTINIGILALLRHQDGVVYLTLEDAARLTGRNPEVVRRWIKNEESPLKATKHGREWLIDFRDFADAAIWMSTQKKHGQPHTKAQRKRIREIAERDRQERNATP